MSDNHLDRLPLATPIEPNLFVVGIGASAGGLRALEEFFENMPVDSGAAFVVIQHLSPDFKSLMKELLERRTRMEIYRVTDGMDLAANSIYLIPPGKNLAIENQRLHLSEQGERNRHGLNFPIDIFLESLAKNYAERSIGLILSGTGSDGTNGIRAINEVGGLTLVQDPATAEFDGMPRTAISTGLVDRVLSPQDLAQTVYQIVRSGVNRAEYLHPNTASFDSFKLQRVASILAKHENTDFSHYKLSTLSRRIHRRCLISGCNNLEDYVRLLEVSNEERNILRHDMLISVTQFFRDGEAWRFLETTAIPKLIEQAQAGDELRFWVTACATGEEAYSLAMLVDEAIERLDKPVRFKIFATDIDKEALEKATAGIYPDTLAHNISAERLQRYFVRKEQSYQVIRKLREKLLFAPHDLTKDAGFTRMNLISCRNVLIYMQPQLQQQVLRNLHFSLQPKGVLFLGEAETLGDIEEEFKPLNKKGKIYEKRRDVRLPLPIKGQANIAPKFLPQPKAKELQESRFEPLLNEAFSAFLVEQKATCLLVDKEYKLFHIFNHTIDILNFTTGRTTIEVDKLVVPNLQLPLTTALHRAKRERVPVIYTGIKVGEGQQTRNVTLKVSYHETSKLAGDFFMAIVREDGRVPIPEGESFEANNEASQHILELEYELQQTRENLQAVIEELETTNEEQQATNEELTASNEELQSTNEELHSVNEELYTVNAEYQSKIEELTELNNDIDNLLRSTDIGVVFLDRSLRIRKFTPAATVAINLVEADIGRPLQHITHNLDCVDLMQLLQETIESKIAADREVRVSQDGFHLLMRVNPYQQEDGRLDGIVLTFVDIDRIKQVEHQLKQVELALRHANEELEGQVAERTFAFQQSEQRLRAIVENTTSIVYIKDLDGRYLLINPQYGELLNKTPDEIIGKTDRDLFPPATAETAIANDRSVFSQQIPLEFEETIPLADGSSQTYIAIKAPLRNDRGEVYALCCISTNITEQKQIEQELRESALRERATLQVVERIRQTLEPAEIFRTTTDKLQEALRCDRVVIYQLHTAGGGTFVAETVTEGWTSLLDSQMYDCKITHDCWLPAQDNRIFTVDDIETADWDECHRELYRKLQARACCIVPVSDGEKLWGLLGAYQNDRARQWKSGDVALLTQVSIQLGVSIQQANLFAQIQNQSLQLQQAKETAESANRAKSNFIAHMNHELRTPLNAILGSSQMLQQDTNFSTAQRSSISLIQKSGQHLQTLIDDILSLAKIEAGKLELQLNHFPFPSFLDNLLDLVRLRAYQQGIELQFQALSPLPVSIYGDETRLRQVCLNLLGNAVKFTPQGKVTFLVGSVTSFDAESIAPPTRLRFQIEDTGIGIPIDRLQDIFLPFEQVNRGAREIDEGTGLGLSISQNIVKLLGGEIQVTSTVDRGSTFWFDLDLPAIDTQPHIPASYAPYQAIGYQGDRQQILIVDDRTDNRTILVNFLTSLGFEVTQADNGRTAIDLALTRPPAAIILDLVMPGIDGWEVARQIRQSPQGAQIKIIATSASNLSEDRSWRDEAGCDDFIDKPIQFSRLLDLLQHHLQLVWIEPTTEDRFANAPLPPRATIERLSALTRQGDIRGILGSIDTLAAARPELDLFSTEIRRLAQDFQIDRLQQFLSSIVEFSSE